MPWQRPAGANCARNLEAKRLQDNWFSTFWRFQRPGNVRNLASASPLSPRPMVHNLMLDRAESCSIQSVACGMYNHAEQVRIHGITHHNAPSTPHRCPEAHSAPIPRGLINALSYQAPPQRPPSFSSTKTPRPVVVRPLLGALARTRHRA